MMIKMFELKTYARRCCDKVGFVIAGEWWSGSGRGRAQCKLRSGKWGCMMIVVC